MTDHRSQLPTTADPTVSGHGPTLTEGRGEAEQLIELLTAQRELYRQLQELAQRQAQLIATGQTEALLGVLTQRQRLVDRLSAINGQIAPLRERISELSPSLPEERRRVLRELVAEVQQLLQSIIDGDEQDRRQLEAAKDHSASEAGQATRIGTALHAYRPPSPAQPRFADHAG